MNLNDTIKTQLNHRSIRHFKNQQLDKETLNTLYEVANILQVASFFNNSLLFMLQTRTNALS